ncbi:hypothetical protein [Kiloniella sp. b19]|uniref:hypothetical protein n=1 Tax=Kiloniella sp. GXU_MW_B19 TaxID=3141326 RepID=UPI0031E37574
MRLNWSSLDKKPKDGEPVLFCFSARNRKYQLFEFIRIGHYREKNQSFLDTEGIERTGHTQERVTHWAKLQLRSRKRGRDPDSEGNHRCWLSFLAGLTFGGILTTFVLWHQIDNRYAMGFNAGEIKGNSDVIAFMKDHLNANPLSAKYYDYKNYHIEAVKLKNIETFRIEE